MKNVQGSLGKTLFLRGAGSVHVPSWTLVDAKVTTSSRLKVRMTEGETVGGVHGQGVSTSRVRKSKQPVLAVAV